MNVTREDKKIEAISRMKQLGIYSETVRQFEKNDQVSISAPPLGAFFRAEKDELERIRDFETDYNTLVYLVIRSFTNFGKLDHFLYVSDHPDEWEMARDALQHNEAMVYAYNYDEPDCSEIGSIGIAQTPAAGLTRTW